MSAINRAVYFFSSIWHRKENDSDFSIFLAAGPLSVFCSTIVGLQRSANIDLVFLAMLGMVLCIRGRMRGFLYSMMLLILGALVKHAFFLDFHLWQLGIEATVAVGFALTAAAVDLIHKKETTLIDQASRREKTIRNLEEDLAKARQELLEGQIAFQDRLSEIQKQLDESLSESSSFQILNDVLRKTSAQTNVE